MAATDRQVAGQIHLFCSNAVAVVVAMLWASVASDSVMFASWAASRTS